MKRDNLETLIFFGIMVIIVAINIAYAVFK